MIPEWVIWGVSFLDFQVCVLLVTFQILCRNHLPNKKNSNFGFWEHSGICFKVIFEYYKVGAFTAILLFININLISNSCYLLNICMCKVHNWIYYKFVVCIINILQIWNFCLFFFLFYLYLYTSYLPIILIWLELVLQI